MENPASWTELEKRLDDTLNRYEFYYKDVENFFLLPTIANTLAWDILLINKWDMADNAVKERFNDLKWDILNILLTYKRNFDGEFISIPSKITNHLTLLGKIT